jgi:hypothetical protein
LRPKWKDSAYRSGRSPDWLKMKNANAPAVKREAEEEWAGDFAAQASFGSVAHPATSQLFSRLLWIIGATCR